MGRRHDVAPELGVIGAGTLRQGAQLVGGKAQRPVKLPGGEDETQHEAEENGSECYANNPAAIELPELEQVSH
jgi:hypothetical protein